MIPVAQKPFDCCANGNGMLPETPFFKNGTGYTLATCARRSTPARRTSRSISVNRTKKEYAMKSRIAIASIVALCAIGANAQTNGLTREEVRQELKQDVEIRQELAQHLEVAQQAGCNLHAVAEDINARNNCNALIARIATQNGTGAAAKLASFKSANNVR
jgi:hypothetical protein